MQTKLYVGNLSYKTKDEDLKAAFEEAGVVVSAKILTDRETGRSRGFGFVEMETEEGAQAAVEKLNGYTLDGRNLKVDESRPQERRGPGGGGGGGDRGKSY
jgi:RNA recognition motif-containing protein